MGSKVFSSGLAVRPADASDCHDVWLWRNDPHTRAMSRNSDIVALETHRNWYADALKRSDRTLMIGETSLIGRIGFVRFDRDADGLCAEISINLNPAARGMGYARPLLQTAITEYWRTQPLPITAQIRLNNPASLRCFEGVGFERRDDDGQYADYLLEFAHAEKPKGRRRSLAG